MERIRVRLSQNEAEHLKLEIRPNNKHGNAKYRLTPKQHKEIKQYRLTNHVSSNTKSNNYDTPFVLSAWNSKGYMMCIDEYCKHYKLPRKDVQSYKLVSHTGTPFYNIVFKENILESEIDYTFIESLVKKYVKPIQSKPYTLRETDYFNRVILTDVHIGMTPNKSGFALYGGKWDRDELLKRAETLCNEIKPSGDLLIIDDLGDLVDGWNAETVRKGHKLPQNMDNQQMFDVALEFKLFIIDNLAQDYGQIIINNICEDNHAGAFGYVVNSAFKQIVEQRYENVKVTNHRKFINHYIIGKHAFIISHGKDSHALKFGFKPQLDTKQSEKIDQYIKQNGIYKKADYIEFSKGDSHQMLFDYTTSDDFDYFNYPAFSPSSEWIQTNFKKGKSGFVLQSISYNDNKKEIIPYFFK